MMRLEYGQGHRIFGDLFGHLFFGRLFGMPTNEYYKGNMYNIAS